MDSSLKTLKTVVGLVIDRVFLAKFTRTGKSKPGCPRKERFQEYETILKVFFVLVSKAHPTYNKKMMEKHVHGQCDGDQIILVETTTNGNHSNDVVQQHRNSSNFKSSVGSYIHDYVSMSERLK